MVSNRGTIFASCRYRREVTPWVRPLQRCSALWARPVFCVACLGPCSDSPPHQFHRCMAQYAVGARREWEPRLIQVMRPSVSWCKLYAKSTSPLERTCLILSCGEYLTCEARVRLASTIVGGWVDAIRKGHPTYAAYVKGKGLKACLGLYNSLRPSAPTPLPS